MQHARARPASDKHVMAGPAAASAKAGRLTDLFAKPARRRSKAPGPWWRASRRNISTRMCWRVELVAVNNAVERPEPDCALSHWNV